MLKKKDKSITGKKYTFFESPLDTISSLDYNKDIKSTTIILNNPHHNHYFNSRNLLSSEPTVENGGMENTLLSVEDAKPDVYFRKKITPEWRRNNLQQIPQEQMDIVNKYMGS